MEIYLDNAATTKPSNEALEEYVRVSKMYYGNPSALHKMGLEAEKIIEKARGQTAASLQCDAKEVIFTSGGTESDNLAIIGAVRAAKHRGKHIITSKIEHHAVLHTCAYLEQNGYSVSYIDALPNGEVDLDQLKQAVRPDTVLISLMALNNETGTVQPVSELKSIAPHALIHSDCVQAYGKIPLSPADLQVDMMSLSGHKIHAVKGVGVLYVRKGVHIVPISYGGDQEGIRSGTMNTAGIAAFGVQAHKICGSEEESMRTLKARRDYFAQRLLEEIPDAVINGQKAVHILNVGFENVRGEVLLHALENAGIYVSTGSACTSKSTKISHVLQAMHVKPSVAQGSIRISLSLDTTTEQIDRAVLEIKKQTDFLKKFKRR